jgi:hypothetical protein
MAENYGNNVSNVLETIKHSFSNVVWQAGKPPLDSELNLVGQISWETLSDTIRNTCHSGFLLDPLRTEEDFVFYKEASNYFELNRGLENPLIALVNGWVVPVVGSNSADGIKNQIKLPPPPSTEARTDVVFLEVWRTILSPNDTTNKPTPTTIFPYGNTEYVASSLNDEMIDSTVGFETTKRVQTQYRFRVTTGNNSLETYLEGLGSPDIYGQGTNTNPQNAYTFSNMQSEGDVGLWRAGNGDPTNTLGTVDGYVYAIPVCAIFRRNSSGYSAVEFNSLHPSHNGSTSRTPSGTQGVLSLVSLNQDISNSDIGQINVTGLTASGLDDGLFFQNGATLFLEIGEGIQKEIIKISSVDTANNQITIASRGHGGTSPKPHANSSSIRMYLSRADGLYADQVNKYDLIDLRHATNLGGWDYNQLLSNSVSDLLTNNLRTTMKQAGAGSFDKGVVVEEVSVFSTTDTFVYCNIKDKTDAVRTIWSDASALQTDVSFLVDLNQADPLITNIDTTTTGTWTIAPSLQPRAYFTDNGVGNKTYTNGTCFFFNIGGASGTDGLRLGLIQDKNTVKFVAPREKQGYNPFKIVFPTFNRPNAIGESGTQGLYTSPTKESNFEEPYIVLGDIVQSSTTSTANLINLELSASLGDISSDKVWAINTANLNYDNIADTLTLHNTTTLRNLITKDGMDNSGFSSEAYLVVYGDDLNAENNGCFKIIGAGNITKINNSLTNPVANNVANHLFLSRIGSSTDLFVNNNGSTVTLEIRTQKLDSRDTSTCIVLTSVKDSDTAHNFPDIADRGVDMLISSTVLWPPAHGAMARTLDEINRVGIKNISQSFLRNSPRGLDSEFSDLPEGEIFLPTTNHISTWNRLSSEGLYCGEGGDTNYGGLVVSGEIDKEAEVFYDLGSKSLILRPFSRQLMKTYRATSNVNIIGTGYAGINNNNPYVAGFTSVYQVPHESMPKFGRQDIPYHVKTGNNDLYMEGLNHLFLDVRNDNANDVYKIIGGDDNLGNSGIKPIFFTTLGNYGAIGAIDANINTNAYSSEKVEISSLPTTDFGDTLRGIKLPPFFGIARVYGVYELENLKSLGVNWSGSGFLTDRETKVENDLVNLLRKDAESYTLYIQKGGGDTLTGESDSPAYILTEHAIDISLISSYTSNSKFSDFNYVIECSVFGFGRGFINKNNFVLARNRAGDGTLNNVANEHLSSIPVVMPSAVDQSETAYVSGSRTVYQGDPFYTIGGNSVELSDSPIRQGQISASNSYYLSQRRDQLDEQGNTAIEILNRRTYEVLASMDFYTTLGSGAIGGTTYKNTPTDVGYASYTSRIPSSVNEDLPQNHTSLFTAPRVEVSKARASLVLFEDYKTYYFNDLATERKLLISVTENGVTTTVSSEIDTSLLNYAKALQTNFKTSGFEVDVINNTTSISLVFYSNLLGSQGNDTTLSVAIVDPNLGETIDSYAFVRLYSGLRETSIISNKTLQKVNFSDGKDSPSNGGVGVTDISLVGLTSRLPLGVLLSDHDFLCEDPLRDSSTSLQTLSSRLTSLPSTVGVSPTGTPYTKIIGATGELLQMGDGDLENYIAYNSTLHPVGTKKYRIHRGGGAVFGASGNVPGAPLGWLNESFGEETLPILKGGVLSCRAMLVRNFKETAFEGSPSIRTYGDEIQMVVVTQGVFKNSGNNTITIGGEISPSGFGEGYASADRFRVKGRPLVKTNSKDIEAVTPAKYNA